MYPDHITTPITDFIRDYAGSGIARFHMPGHKGHNPVFPESAAPTADCYSMDLTEIHGADSLYEAEGIIRESETNASRLFDTGATFYSTEGSSQCIRAMLALVTRFSGNPRDSLSRPVILAARNVHRSFLTAAALLDLDVEWLFPENKEFSLCSCPITPDQVRSALAKMPRKAAAVYLTSPDYLGNIQDISAIADAAHAFGIPLLVDNAHGSYLHFLPQAMHPMDLGADLCCDSAHKTLPALTGCAYLHIRKDAPDSWQANARKALALFGSTSPSYLLLQSLDAVNRILAESFRADLEHCVKEINSCKRQLGHAGWKLMDHHSEAAASEPLKITFCADECGYSGIQLASLLRLQDIECEYADPERMVLMVTPSNPAEDLTRLVKAMQQFPVQTALPKEPSSLQCLHPKRIISIREASFAPSESIPVKQAVGRICADTAISCPPAIPIIVCGERIPAEALPIFHHYHIAEVSVIK